MALHFLVKEGPRKGDEFKIVSGSVIGRTKGDITLRDPKASGQHARVEEDDDGNFVLVDLNSSNGIWLEDEKKARITLTPGVVVKVGETLLEVIEAFALDLDENTRDTWQGKLWSYFRGLASSLPTKTPTASHITPPLQLEFTKGPQAGQVWYVGYGPRSIGVGSPDLPIDDPTALDLCFEIQASDGAAVFFTPRPDRVRLNEHQIESETLKDGDVISFGDNEIKVTHKPV